MIVLVVAADDGIQKQTLECIRIAKDSGGMHWRGYVVSIICVRN